MTMTTSNMRLVLVSIAVAAGSAWVFTACSDDTSPVTESPVDFQAGPASFPSGSEIAVLQGDPSQSGEYTVRLRLPDGYQLPPHFHPTDEHVTVVEGTFLVGMGDAVDLASATTLGQGGFVVAPAGVHHYAAARGKTVVQVHGEGPFAITYVNPADDPANQ